MNITIRGYKSDGVEIPLGSPITINYECFLSGVETKVYVKLPSQPSNKIAKLNVYIDNNQFFTGFVDSIGRTIDEDGDFGFISATCYFARIAQNQVYPKTLNNVSSQTIFNSYAAPYGVTNNEFLPKTISKLEVTAGMTAWDVLDIFARQAYDLTPAIRKNGTLSTGGFSRADITIGEGGIPYTSLKYTDDRSGMFSRVYMQASDNEYDFSIYTDNSLAPACGISRERFYKPPKSWKDFSKRGAGEVLRNSNKKR